MHIDAVEKRAADLRKITLNDAGRAAAFSRVIPVKAARVRLRILVAVAKSGLYCRTRTSARRLNS